MVTSSFSEILISGSVRDLVFHCTSWVSGLNTPLRHFLRLFHIFFFFFCFQVWRWLYNSCTNSRVQPWFEACPGILWTCLSRKCPKREAPEHAAIPASILVIFSSQDLQHPFPEQKATPYRRLLCFSDNPWPSKIWVSKYIYFSGWGFLSPVPYPHYGP